MTTSRNLCKDCFIKYVDQETSEKYLMVGTKPIRCEGCRRQRVPVIAHFKYGEHETKDGCTKLVR